jgi:hypothetical protein
MRLRSLTKVPQEVTKRNRQKSDTVTALHSKALSMNKEQLLFLLPEVKINNKPLWYTFEECDVDITQVSKLKPGKIESSDNGKRRFMLDTSSLSVEYIKKQEIIHELVLTEQAYLQDLHMIQEVCFKLFF